MDRVASLQKRAASLTARLLQSLPFHRRFALLIEKLAGIPITTLQALGKSLGAIFLLKGVKGLPPVHGVDADEFRKTMPQDLGQLFRALPNDYMHHFAQTVVDGVLPKFHHNETAVRDAISGWLSRFIAGDGWASMHEGLSLSTARNYAITGIHREGINQGKAERAPTTMKDVGRAAPHSMHETDQEGRMKYNPADPDAVRRIVENTPAWKTPRVRKILEQRVHPAAPQFLDLIEEGIPMKRIVGDPRQGIPTMLDALQGNEMSYENWRKNYNPKILKVFEDLDLINKGLIER